jgi:hypothetical protein
MVPEEPAFGQNVRKLAILLFAFNNLERYGRTFCPETMNELKKYEEAGLDVGRWLGRREAFGLVAGHCSAAEAETLRRIRDGRMYRDDGTWDEFCRKRIGVSRRHVDRTLHLLEEFGPAYFHVAQMAHVTPEEYRAIAPHVGDDGVRLNGAVVALLPENSEQVSAAVAELLRRERPKQAKPAPTAFESAVKKCETAAEALAALDGPLERGQKLALTHQICRILTSASSRGVCIANV